MVEEATKCKWVNKKEWLNFLLWKRSSDTNCTKHLPSCLISRVFTVRCWDLWSQMEAYSTLMVTEQQHPALAGNVSADLNITGMERNMTIFQNSENLLCYRIPISWKWSLTLNMLGKIFGKQHIEIFSQENRFWHFMQIVSIGDNLHEMSNSVFWEN